MKRNIKTVMIVTGIFLNQLSTAQNLVPNWSFEDTISCPPNIDAIDYAIGWSSYMVTPNYYNACAPNINPSNSVPDNLYGFQYARTGNAYAGVTTIAITGTFREFIGCQLIQNLQVGIRYYGSFYISKAEKYLNMASNKIGIRLSTVPFSQSSPTSTVNYAQVFIDSIITDTLNWIRVEGSFIADSAYSYLMLGNSFDNSNTSYIQLDSTSGYAYYYVDDIYLANVPDSGFGNLSNQSENSFLVYPCPANNFIFIKSKTPCTLFLYDTLGKILFVNFIHDENFKMDISNLSAGIYFVNLISTNGSSSTKKLIISKL